MVMVKVPAVTTSWLGGLTDATHAALSGEQRITDCPSLDDAFRHHPAPQAIVLAALLSATRKLLR